VLRGAWIVSIFLLCLMCTEAVAGCDCFDLSAASVHADCGCVGCACCGFCLSRPLAAVAIALARNEPLPDLPSSRPSDEITLNIDHPPRS
jgi:hypothetical protein